MEVPFFDWQGLYSENKDEFSRILDTTLSAGQFILQNEVKDFEKKLTAFVGVRYAVGLSDGTNAILLGLRASGIGAGDEIIIAGHSFIAAAQSIHHVGATPVPVELCESDWLVCPDSIESAITSKTKAIMAVHVNGRMCQMDRIIEIAKKHGLKVFEDAAQAMGARFQTAGAGSMADWGTYSFYPSKTLGCFGDAGALVTNNPDIYEKVLAMRNHGANQDKSIPLDIEVWGTNCRLDNIHAAILSFKMTYYESVIEKRRKIAKKYHEMLSQFEEVRLPPAPQKDGKYYDIFQNFEFCVPQRDALRVFLADQGVGTIIQWGGFGIHQLKNLGMGKSLPKTDKFFKESLLLPLNHVMSDGQVERVCEITENFFRKK